MDGTSTTHCGVEKSIPKYFMLVHLIVMRFLMLHVMSLGLHSCGTVINISD
jgi:hypothetical protein